MNAEPWSDFDFGAFNARVAATYAAMRARLSQPCYGLAPPALSDHPPDLSDDVPHTIASAARTSPAQTFASSARTPPARSDHAPQVLSPSACSAPSAVKPPFKSSEHRAYDFESLMIALDELITALRAATQSASDYGITWLQNRFTTFRRRIKAIKNSTQALNRLPADSLCPC